MPRTQCKQTPRASNERKRIKAQREFDRALVPISERQAIHQARSETHRIAQLLAKARTSPEVTDAVLADVYQAHALQAIAHAETVLADADYASAINGAVKALDRSRLLRGQATSISGVASVEDKRAALLALISEHSIDTRIDNDTREALEKAGGGEEGSCNGSEDGECDTTPTQVKVT